MNGKDREEIAKIVTQVLSQQALSPQFVTSEIPMVILHETSRNCEGAVLEERIISVRGHDLEDVVKKAKDLERRKR